MKPSGVSPGTARGILCCVLVLGLALRLGSALAWPGQVWPDEVFQTLEPAHRLAFGSGFVTWEYRDGCRSWVYPAFLAACMVAGEGLGPGSTGYLTLITVTGGLVSLVTVLVAFSWCRRLGGERAGVLAALACAVWVDLVHMGHRTLTEVVATHAMLPGLYLGLAGPKTGGRCLAAGLLCGVAVALRLQLAAGVAVGMLFMAWRMKSGRLLARLAIGAVMAPLVFGAVDWLTWGMPFHSYLANVRANLVEGVAEQYGWLPLHYYGVYLWDVWGPAVVLPMAMLVVLGLPRAPALALVAAALVLSHSLVGHKEYRFLYPALPLLLMLAALGGDTLARHAERSGSMARGRAASAVMAVFFCAGSASVAADYTVAEMPTGLGGRRPDLSLWTHHGNELRAMRWLSGQSDVRSVGVHAIEWGWCGGYANLHHGVPVYLLDELDGPEDWLPSCHCLVVGEGSSLALGSLEEVARFGEVRVLRRRGGIAPPPGDYDVGDVIARRAR